LAIGILLGEVGEGTPPCVSEGLEELNQILLVLILPAGALVGVGRLVGLVRFGVRPYGGRWASAPRVRRLTLRASAVADITDAGRVAISGLLAAGRWSGARRQETGRLDEP
jgi:hypothetical protein